MTLRHVPSGRGITLFTDIGGTRDGLAIRIDDEASLDAGDIPDDGVPPDTVLDRGFFGRVNPEGGAQLSVFDNIDASGEWQLTVDDDQFALVATVMVWTLHFDHD